MREDVSAGLVQTLPLLIGLVPFALVFGALAAAKGLSPLEVALMSATVFAGGSQFVAIELWRDPVPLTVLATTTALVNSRHLLMGAMIAPRVMHWPRSGRRVGLFFLADEVWALALARAGGGPLAIGYWLGLGLGLWSVWTSLTALGAALGALVDDPGRWGLDFAFVAVFIALLRGMWRGRESLAPWLSAAVAAALAHMILPGAAPILAGTAAGCAASLIRHKVRGAG